MSKPFKILNWINKNKLPLIGGITGAIGGFLYWKFVGCITGTCAITSHPLRSTLYFAIFGAILAGMWSSKSTEKTNQ